MHVELIFTLQTLSIGWEYMADDLKSHIFNGDVIFWGVRFFKRYPLNSLSFCHWW